MNTPETAGGKPRVLYMSEIDFSLLSPVQAQNYLFTTVREAGLEPEDALYTGFDPLDFEEDGSFGDRTETWAFTTEALQKSTALAEQAGGYQTDSPFFYATRQHPAGLVIFDQRKFVNLGFVQEEDRLREPDEFRLKEGMTMDEAAIAVLIIE